MGRWNIGQWSRNRAKNKGVQVDGAGTPYVRVYDRAVKDAFMDMASSGKYDCSPILNGWQIKLYVTPFTADETDVEDMKKLLKRAEVRARAES